MSQVVEKLNERFFILIARPFNRDKIHRSQSFSNINSLEKIVCARPTAYPVSPIDGGGRVVRWCWVNFQCRGVLQFGLE